MGYTSSYYLAILDPMTMRAVPESVVRAVIPILLADVDWLSPPAAPPESSADDAIPERYLTSAKWYDWADDMSVVSATAPRVVWRIHRLGEEAPDEEVGYFYKGVGWRTLRAPWDIPIPPASALPAPTPAYTVDDTLTLRVNRALASATHEPGCAALRAARGRADLSPCDCVLAEIAGRLARETRGETR